MNQCSSDAFHFQARSHKMFHTALDGGNYIQQGPSDKKQTFFQPPQKIRGQKKGQMRGNLCRITQLLLLISDPVQQKRLVFFLSGKKWFIGWREEWELKTGRMSCLGHLLQSVLLWESVCVCMCACLKGLANALCH